MRNSILAFFLLSILTLSASGCATVMAAHQPGQKNLNVLTVGTPRDVVIGELGMPIQSEVEGGNSVDIFKFVQGYSQANKTIRTLGHGVADVFTLGLWEVVGTPTEATFHGQDVAVKVTYDQNKNVSQVNYLQKK